MRYIRKLPEPSELKQWKKDNAATPQNLCYGNLPGKVNEAVKRNLLQEQGFVCAYTMRRLSGLKDCHIEHVLAQNAAREEDLEYANMAACFPGNGGDTSHGYGAPIKAGTKVAHNDNFVSPHNPGCEQRFRYDKKGAISAAKGDRAAESAIGILKLNHGKLVDLRRGAIEAHGLALRHGSTRKARKPISAAEARRFAEKVLEPSPEGRLEPFCVALSQVALEYADKEEARSDRMKARYRVP